MDVAAVRTGTGGDGKGMEKDEEKMRRSGAGLSLSGRREKLLLDPPTDTYTALVQPRRSC
jgi:hypothetical protein